MLSPRTEGEPSSVIALGGFGAVIGAAAGAMLIGSSGFVGIVVSALIGTFAGMILGRAIQ
jgi:hypothetical protein